MIGRIAAAACICAALATATPRLATGEEGITRAQADSLLIELKQIRQLLEKNLQQQARQVAPAPAPERTVTLPLGKVFKLGRDDAPVTLVEFADYECPYCRQFETTVFEQLRTNWIDTGKVRFISRDLPLDFHPHSAAAANAARCAGEQGKYWDLRRVMIINDSQLDSLSLVVYARDLGLDTTRFQACATSHRFAAEIHKDQMDAQAAGITGTPTFVLGRTVKQGVDGTVIVGTMPYADLDARIRRLLAKK